MTDLHPERLLHESHHTPGTRTTPQLRLHLAECEVCGLELATRWAAAEESRTRGPVKDVESRIASVMEELDLLAPESTTDPSATRHGTTGRLAASLAAVVALALVLMGYALTPHMGNATEGIRAPASAQAVHGLASAPASALVTRRDPANTDRVDLTSVPRPKPPATNTPRVSPPTPVARTARPRRPKDTEALPPRSAAVLFDEATALVSQGDHDDALRVFETLQETHPNSREAHTSLAIAGQLWLHHQANPTRALADFDNYLKRRPATLRPEVLADKARALEALGRSQQARAVWQELARTYPDSAPGREASTRIGDDH